MVDVAINQDIKALQFDHAKLNVDYVVSYLNAKEKYILHSIIKTGTTVQSVSMPDLNKMLFPIPGHTEQVKIGNLMMSLDHLIAANEYKLKSTLKNQRCLKESFFNYL